MILSCAIRLLISPKNSYTYNNVAKMLIKQFIINILHIMEKNI